MRIRAHYAEPTITNYLVSLSRQRIILLLVMMLKEG